MRKVYVILSIILIVIISGCNRPLILSKVKVGQPGYFTFGKNAQRDFYHPETVTDSIELIWDDNTKGSFTHTSVVCYDGYVFAPDLSGRVYCFHDSVGLEIASKKHIGEIAVAPVVYKRRIFYLNNEWEEKYCTLYYWDFGVGRMINELIIPRAVTNEIVYTGDALFLLTDTGILFRVNLIGEIDWSTETNINSNSSPAADLQSVYLANQNGELISVDQGSGKINYRVKISNTGFEGGITINSGYVYLGDNDGIIYCLDPRDGSVVWSYKSSAKIKSIPVLDEESLYIGNLNGEILKLNKISGELLWLNKVDGVINTTPILFRNFLIQPNLKNALHFINTVSGDITNTYRFKGRPKYSPVFWDGKLYLGADKAELMAFRFVERGETDD